MTAFLFDEMDLPLTNPKEELETISRNQLHPIFTENLFEIRSEDYRDKGIDLTVEIKKNAKYTNFRFLIQLKATDSIEPNKDGSLSLQIRTSNINYLLNGNSSAYYILYFKKQDIFLYEDLNVFIKTLSRKDEDWGKQRSHALRLYKELNENALQDIYQKTLSRGLFQRTLNEKLAVKSANLESGDGVVVDVDNLTITDDSEIREIIESVGITLINETRWKDVIQLHQKATGNVAKTATYNMILGMARYYNGQLLDSLSHLKQARRKSEELPQKLHSHLQYFEIITKSALGLISEQEFNSLMKDIEQEQDIGLYARLLRIKATYLKGHELDYDQFMSELEEIINSPNVSANIKLIAQGEKVLFEGSRNNMDYFQGIVNINVIEEIVGPNRDIRASWATEFLSKNSSWMKNVQECKNESIQTKNHFALFMIIINEAKVRYEQEVYFKHVRIDVNDQAINSTEIPDTSATLYSSLENLHQAASFYRNIGHIENLAVSLIVTYEICHFLGEVDQCKETYEELNELVENYDLEEQRERIKKLVNNETTHELLLAMLNETLEKDRPVLQEMKEKRNLMIKMDTKESFMTRDFEGSFTIELFPIGVFLVPKNKLQQMFEILRIDSDLVRQGFVRMFEMSITPIANIYLSPIETEGYCEGILENKGFDNFLNLFRVRKSFFENNFLRAQHS